MPTNMLGSISNYNLLNIFAVKISPDQLYKNLASLNCLTKLIHHKIFAIYFMLQASFCMH
jgi:hypothetical protein